MNTTTSSFKRAQQIIQSLIDGVDPDSGEPLPSDGVLQRVEVVRAFLVCASALEQTKKRAIRRSQLPENVGRSWNDDEEKILIQGYKEGLNVHELAFIHRRTVRAIEARLERLSLLTAEQRTTDNSFVTPGKKKDETHE